MTEQYYARLASAVTRGYFKRYRLIMDKELMEKDIYMLSCEEMEKIISLGKQEYDLGLHNFKIPGRMLARVSRVLGFLKGLCFENLLDVGTGRGSFLIPLLNDLSSVQVTAVDLLRKRVNMLNDLKNGGIANLSVMQGDFCAMKIQPKSYDVVTMLEVLDDMPDYASAIASAVKIAKKYVIISAPTKPIEGLESKRTFTKELLSQCLYSLGAENVFFEAVHNHFIIIANLGG
ncbi:MAG: class I SAM-dependent methyltransferase [Clostridia bacterium]|nr:class I SAM-dependent methyltransferase [Clostridia bacterium]